MKEVPRTNYNIIRADPDSDRVDCSDFGTGEEPFKWDTRNDTDNILKCEEENLGYDIFLNPAW